MSGPGKRWWQFWRKAPAPTSAYSYLSDPDVIHIEGVECRWGIPRACRNPSSETCKYYGCDMRGGNTP